MANSFPFIGEIGIFAFGWVPDGWLACNGQLFPVTQYSALFSIIKNRFGGDGTTSFALPDLNDCVPMGVGTGPGLPAVQLAATVGSDGVALTNATSAHGHRLQRKAVSAITQKTNQLGPNTNLGQIARQWDTSGDQWELVPHFLANTGPDSTLAPRTIEPVGAGQGHENRQPYLGVTYAIASEGEYPPRP